MVVNDFDFIRPRLGPNEANAVLIIDSDAQDLQAVARWKTQLVNHDNGIELLKFANGYTPE
jgi:hypothetical protein